MDKKLIAGIICGVVIVGLCIMGIQHIIVRKAARKLQMTPKKIDAIYEYGCAQYSNGDFDKAINSFKIIVKEETTSEKKEQALLKLAEIYEKINYPDKARDTYKEIVEYFPSLDAISEIHNKLEGLNIKILFSPIITKESFQYEIKPNDTLGQIAGKYRTTVGLLKKSNNLNSDIIIPGKFLKIPKSTFSVLIDKSQNLVFLKSEGEIIKTYTASTGENNSTPVGTFKIEEKLISPVWYKIGAVVSPDSPEYELGTRWMGLSVSGYGIHGTKDPRTIGKHITKGCIRLLNKDVEELYTILPSGTEVIIVD